jgi:hypothetical protein
MEIVIRIVLWAIIIFAVMAWLASKSGGGADSDFDTKDPGDFY